MFLLDTNVVSELRKGERCHPQVVAFAEALLRSDEAYISVLAIAEIQTGIERLALRDTASAGHLRQWLMELRGQYRDRILPITQEIADAWAAMNVARVLPAVDSLMAATAKVKGLTFVTRDIAGVAGCGALLLNPWEYSAP